MKNIIPLMVLLLMACGSTPAHHTSDASSIEEEAVDHLYDVLNSGKGCQNRQKRLTFLELQVILRVL